MGAHRDPSLRGSDRRRGYPPATLNGAFTLIELLVTISIIAVLIGILLPVLASARGSAVHIKSMSNARQLAQVITMYADSSDGLCPATEDGVMYPATSLNGVSYAFPYWQIYETWTGVVFDILPYDEAVGVYVSPTSLRYDESDAPWPSSYMYSTSFAGQPALWAPGATADGDLRVPVRLYQVRFPSNKALLWDSELAWVVDIERDEVTGDLRVATPVAFADGSCDRRVPAEATDPQPNPFGDQLADMRLHNTPLGVFGRDY